MLRGADTADDATLVELVQRVAEDGKAAVRAEIAVYKAIAAYRLSGMKVGVPLLVAALFLLQAVLTTLLVGILLVLAPRLGVGWSTLLVVVAGLAAAGLAAWLGVKRLGSLFAPLPGEGGGR